MAQQIYCDFDDGEPAILLVTNIGNGDTQGICVGHVLPWTVTMAEQFGGMVPDPETFSRQDIVDAVTNRIAELDTMKGSKAVKEARLNEVQAIGEAIILGAPIASLGIVGEDASNPEQEGTTMGQPVFPAPGMSKDEAAALGPTPDDLKHVDPPAGSHAADTGETTDQPSLETVPVSQ